MLAGTSVGTAPPLHYKVLCLAIESQCPGLSKLFLVFTLAAEDEARAKALRQEIRAAMEAGRTEMAGILTADQKTRLEELNQERKAKIEQPIKERR